MLCVACDNRASFANVEKWKAQIQEVDPEKPIILIMTKGDVEKSCDDPITM